MSLELIKKLRGELGAGVNDCQKALKEAHGDYDEAVKILRKKGISKAAGKSGRDTSEGLVCIAQDNEGVAMIELNCETDFVARNEKFQSLADKLLNVVLDKKNDSLDEILKSKIDDTDVNDFILESAGSIGENIALSKVYYRALNGSLVATYVHNNVDGNIRMGKIAVVLFAKCDRNSKVETMLKNISMHIAAANPISLNKDSVPEDIQNREMEIYIDQAKASGKPEEIAKKMAEGRMRKFFEESVLLEQTFVMDGKTKVCDIIKQSGFSIELVDFKRLQLGC